MALVDRFVVCTCGRPMPVGAVKHGVHCAVCGRDLFDFMWSERERISAEEAATRGKGRPKKKHYYQ